MSLPQDPAVHRSRTVPAIDPDATESELESTDRPTDEGTTGPVPPANQPGSDSGPVQDKPDPDDFVERFSSGGDTADESTSTGRVIARIAAVAVILAVVGYAIRRRRAN